MLRKYLIAWAAGAALVLGILGAEPSAQARSLDQIVSSKKMRIGIIPVEEMVVRDPNSGELSGIWIDGIRRPFSTMNIEPEFVETKMGDFRRSSAGRSDRRLHLRIHDPSTGACA